MQSLPTGNSYLSNLRGEEGKNHPPTSGGKAPATAPRERRFRRPHRDPPRGRRRRGAGRGRHRLRAGVSSWPGPPRGACLSPPPHLEPPLLAPVPAPPSTSGLSGPFPAPALRARPAPVAPPGCRPLPPLTLCSVPRGAGRSRPRHVTRGARGAPGTAAPSRPDGPRAAPRVRLGRALCRTQGKAGPARTKHCNQGLPVCLPASLPLGSSEPAAVVPKPRTGSASCRTPALAAASVCSAPRLLFAAVSTPQACSPSPCVPAV